MRRKEISVKLLKLSLAAAILMGASTSAIAGAPITIRLTPEKASDADYNAFKSYARCMTQPSFPSASQFQARVNSCSRYARSIKSANVRGMQQWFQNQVKLSPGANTQVTISRS